MGKLDKYARQFKEDRSKVLPIRLPENLYHQFQQRCDALGLSMSEAGYLLIREELESYVYASTTNEVAATTLKAQESIQTEHISNTKPTTNVRRMSSPSVRWTSSKYEVLNELPCPICDNWYSKTNFARHAKSHNMTTQELLEDNKDTVLIMIDTRKKGS